MLSDLQILSQSIGSKRSFLFLLTLGALAKAETIRSELPYKLIQRIDRWKLEHIFLRADTGRTLVQMEMETLSKSP